MLYFYDYTPCQSLSRTTHSHKKVLTNSSKTISTFIAVFIALTKSSFCRACPSDHDRGEWICIRDISILISISNADYDCIILHSKIMRLYKYWIISIKYIYFMILTRLPFAGLPPVQLWWIVQIVQIDCDCATGGGHNFVCTQPHTRYWFVSPIIDGQTFIISPLRIQLL